MKSCELAGLKLEKKALEKNFRLMGDAVCSKTKIGKRTKVKKRGE